MFALVLIPFWTSTLIRVFAWTVILERKGVLNWVLGWVGLGPTRLLGTTAAVLIGMCQVLLPFAVLPMFAVMKRIDRRALQAAEVLGAPPMRAFRDVYVPQSLPSVMSAAGIVFILSLGFYITPALLGSPRDSMISVLITTQVQAMGDWARGSALGVILLVATLLVLGLLGLVARKLRIL